MGSFRSVKLLDDLMIYDDYVLKNGDVLTGDLIGKNFVNTRSGVITRTAGLISQIAYIGGRTLDINRIGGLISSITDGVRTWAFSRDANNYVSSWTVI